MTLPVHLIVVEGRLEVPTSVRLLRDLGLLVEGVHPIDKGGRISFWRDAPRYNQASRHIGLVFGLADLQGHPCPSGLIANHLKPDRHENFVLRIAERMLESWFLADAGSLADFLRISEGLVPANPEGLPHPKRTLTDLARRSTNRSIRVDLVPREGSTGIVGPGYTPRMTDYVENYWRPMEAQHRSESLKRAILALKRATNE